MTTKYELNGVEFKVGDKVRIIEVFDDGSRGNMGTGGEWHNSWTHGMVQHKGKRVTIEHIYRNGVYFKEIGYGWPLTALENLTAKGRAVLQAEQEAAAKRRLEQPVKLRPFMRVKLRNERTYIVVPRGTEGNTPTPLIFVGKEGGWTEGVMRHEGNREFHKEWDVIEIYAAPPRGYDMLDHAEKGKLLWSEAEAKAAEQKAIAEAIAAVAAKSAKKVRLAALKAEVEALEKEIAE